MSIPDEPFALDCEEPRHVIEGRVQTWLRAVLTRELQQRFPDASAEEIASVLADGDVKPLLALARRILPLVSV